MNTRAISYVELIYEDQFARYVCAPGALRKALIHMVKTASIKNLMCTDAERAEFVDFIEGLWTIPALSEEIQKFLDQYAHDITLNVEEDGGVYLFE